MSEIQVVGDGWQAFGELMQIESDLISDSNDKPSEETDRLPFKLLCADSKIYVFQERYYNIKMLDWQKYSIAIQGGGGAVLKYRENQPKWERFEFSEFNGDKNTIETYFTHSDSLYVLITSKSKEVHFRSLLKFDPEVEEFMDETIATPGILCMYDKTDVKLVVSDNSTDGPDRILIVTANRELQLYNLDMEFWPNKTISVIGKVKTEELMFPFGCVLAAFRHQHLIFMTYSREDSCGGSTWERHYVLKHNLVAMTIETVSIAGTVETERVFTRGPSSSWCSGFLWGFCGGFVRKGKDNFVFNGESWVIVGLGTSDARWEKREVELGQEHEGLVVTDKANKATIMLSKEKTSVLYHEPQKY